MSQANRRTIKRREQRKRAKNKMNIEYNPWMIKLASINSICQSTPKEVTVDKKENPMYIDYVSSDKHTESAKTNYLLSRLENTSYKLKDDLCKQYGLCNDSAPSTAKELVDRITSGKYILPTEKEEECSRNYYGAILGIKWRDPAIKEDKDGYKIATDALEKAKLDVQDAIMVKTHDEALAAIKAFEAWKL